MPVEEILVHVSTPSTSKDDERYRRMAMACNEFDVAREIVLGQIVTSAQSCTSDDALVPTEPFDLEYHYQMQSEQPHVEAETMNLQTAVSSPILEGKTVVSLAAAYIDDTQVAGAFLESQLFTSSLQAMSSPPASSYSSLKPASSPPVKACNATTPVATGGVLRPSTPDSYDSFLELDTYIPTPLAARVQALKTPQNQVATRLLILSPADPVPNGTGVTPSIKLLTQAPQVWPFDKRHQPAPRLQSPRPLLNAQIATSSTLSAPSNPSGVLPNPPTPTSTDPRGTPAESSSPPQQPPASVEQTPHPKRSPIKIISPDSPLAPTTPQPPLHAFTDEILPPPAPTLLPCSHPSTHSEAHTYITPALHQLATTLSLSTRFKPSMLARALRPAERGYWLVDTRGWDLTLQREFWEHLDEVVGDGRAGWGVTCFRDGGGGGDGEDLEAAAASAQSRLGLVRVYCWGEVVGHVYLLLFVASKSKVKRTSARWVDAGGAVVVTMP